MENAGISISKIGMNRSDEGKMTIPGIIGFIHGIF
jgi:hypothetical protein